MLRDALTSFLRKSRPARRRLRRRRSDCQQLEQRCLLSATIQGRVWEDADADGLAQSSELFLSDVQARLLTMDGTVVDSTTTGEIDQDQSGTIDPAAETGWYRFHTEVAGNYQLQIGGVADSSLTSPRHSHHVVTGSSNLQAIPNHSRNSMFVVGADGVAEIHFRSRTVLNRYEVSVESPRIALSPDKQILAVAGREGSDISVTFFDLSTGEQNRLRISGVQTTLEEGSSSWGRRTTLHIPAPTSEAVASHLSVNRFASGRVNFSWIAAEGNVTYDVLLMSGLNRRKIRHHNSLSVSVDDLPSGVWSWHIRAVTEEGQRGPWVAGEPFNTDSRAVLVVPESFNAVDNVTIRWLAHVEAIRFQVQIDNLTTGQAKVIREDHLTGSRYQTKTSLTPGEYRVWVRAISADGTFAPWSRWHDFTVNQDNATSQDTTN